MIKDNLLIYIQDLGGGQYLLPIVEKLQKKYNLTLKQIIVHPLSENCYRSRGIKFSRRSDSFSSSVISISEWKEFITTEKYKRVLCSTSAQGRDLTNCNLIVAARELGIETVAALDHWKGFDRFFVKGKPVYCPNHLIVIDEKVKANLIRMGVSATQVHVAGHPYLEEVEMRPFVPSGNKFPRVLLVSQPISIDGSFRSIYLFKQNGIPLINQILNEFERVSEASYSLYYRAHPKETLSPEESKILKWDSFQTWEECIRHYDIFIGVNSMALIEASLSGRKVVTLKLSELNQMDDFISPFNYSIEICSILDVVKNLNTSDFALPHSKKFFSHSKDRVLSCLNAIYA